MKNKLFYKFLFIFFVLNFNLNLVNAEQFNFNVTEIEILNNGNLYKGLDRGSIETDDGIVINANTFIYNKITNIVEAEGKVKVEDKINEYTIFTDKAIYKRNEEVVLAEGNSRAIDDQDREIIADKITYSKIPNIVEAEGKVKVEDKIKNYEIYSDKITYFRNDEKINTEGYSEAKIQSEYNFISENVTFKLIPQELSSKFKSTVTDNNNQIYYLDEFLLYLDQDLLKGKGILTITNYNLPKSDKYFFTDGIFNLKNKTFTAKDTKVDIYRNF